MLKIEAIELPADFFQRKVDQLLSGEWVRGPAAEFHQKFLQTTAEHFEILKYGGSNRGVTWKYFSPRSFGMERPSGKKIEPGSLMLQDTGRLKREAGKGFRAVSASEVEFSTNLDYARGHNEGARTFGGRQLLPARPFQFFTGDDLDDLREFTLDWLTGRRPE